MTNVLDCMAYLMEAGNLDRYTVLLMLNKYKKINVFSLIHTALPPLPFFSLRVFLW